jgi:hypothetical protein
LIELAYAVFPYSFPKALSTKAARKEKFQVPGFIAQVSGFRFQVSSLKRRKDRS